MTAGVIRQDNDVELKIAEIMGINAEQAVQGSLQVDLQYNRMTVKWESYVEPTEEQRDKMLAVLATTYTRAPR